MAMKQNARLALCIAVLCWEWTEAVETCLFQDFRLHGDYILGGLFEIHNIGAILGESHRQPVTLQCKRFKFMPSSFLHVQVMRFAIEEINNSSDLLPGVRLGYEIFDYCSELYNHEAAFDFLSLNGSISFKKSSQYMSKVISVTGPFGSTKTLTVAPLFMASLIPMVSYGASTAQLSNKRLFPSFFRTVPNDIYQVRAIVSILKKFQWNWVAFIGDNNDYSQDALTSFIQECRSANICLGYQGTITDKSFDIFHNININKIEVVVVLANIEYVVPFIKDAIQYNVQKIWIASEIWSISHDLAKEGGIETIGTVLGVTIKGHETLFGFEEFLLNTMKREDKKSHRETSCVLKVNTCNQVCTECTTVDPKSILEEDSTYSFSIYSAVYAVAHALHKVLKCGSKDCNISGPVYPYLVTNALKRVKFSLYNYSVEFDENGDSPANYDIVYWDWNASNLFQRIGFYRSDQGRFFIDEKRINWHDNGSIPIWRCSPECDKGYHRVQTGFHECCFDCEVCANGTYINYTADPFNCVACKEDEWSLNGSTSCTKYSLEFLQYSDPMSIWLIFSVVFFLVSSVGIIILFAFNSETPVVKSAGGKMSFCMLTCLSLSSVSVFFFIGKPVHACCFLRIPVFVVFYTACLSCLAVRSFQIVCVFKMAAKLPKAYGFWVKHNGQWLTVLVCILVQFLLCGLWVRENGTLPIQIKLQKEIIFDCSLGNKAIFYVIFAFIGLVSVVCFSFAYIGTDLPKNYNEGKTITFSLLIFYIAWATFLTLRLIITAKHITALNAVSILCSLYGILFGYFFPKGYIIMFKPEHNTAAYFQTSIQSYTIQTSNM